MLNRRAWWISGCVVLILVGSTSWLFSSDSGRSIYRNLKVFADVYDIVKRYYVDNPNDDKLIQGALRGMLEELDPHSVYMPKEEFEDMQQDTRGQFGGLGIEISKKDGFLVVVSPIEDTPAAKAGLKSGDIIAKIEGEITSKMSIFDAVKKMRGAPGKAVNLEIKREGVDKLIPFKIVRAIIQVKSVTSELVDGFPVVKLKQFSEKASAELNQALEKFSAKTPIKGLVLDLRNNPGGLLNQAVEIADKFLTKGLIVYQKGRDKKKQDPKEAVERGTEPNYPLVVLVNGGSASASEIVSGALQVNKRAHILGEKTFGKGSVQNVIPLDNGGGVKLTIALYYTATDKSIQGEGITPDEIVMPLEEANYLREKDLPGHIVGELEKKDPAELAKKEAVKDSKKPNTKKIDPKKLTALEKKDYQLAKAIAYLKKTVSSPAKEVAR